MLSIKKFVSSTLLGLILATAAFAGTEDWNGEYTFLSSENKPYTISHNPTGVQFIFFNTGGCLYLGEGVSINGMVIPVTVTFCRTDTIEKFTSEVQKLGTIISKKITIGPTYPK